MRSHCFLESLCKESLCGESLCGHCGSRSSLGKDAVSHRGNPIAAVGTTECTNECTTQHQNYRKWSVKHTIKTTENGQ